MEARYADSSSVSRAWARARIPRDQSVGTAAARSVSQVRVVSTSLVSPVREAASASSPTASAPYATGSCSKT